MIHILHTVATVYVQDILKVVNESMRQAKNQNLNVILKRPSNVQCLRKFNLEFKF